MIKLGVILVIFNLFFGWGTKLEFLLIISGQKIRVSFFNFFNMGEEKLGFFF